MSIDWLWDLERALENGKVYYACQTAGRNQVGDRQIRGRVEKGCKLRRRPQETRG